MVDQDKSHLHGRHVSENPLTPTASSPPSTPDSHLLPGNLFNRKREGSGIWKQWEKQATLPPPQPPTPVSFCCCCPHSQAAAHFYDGQGINTIKPTVQIEKQKETLLWFNEKQASCLMHKWIFPFCLLSLRICMNSTIFLCQCWETNMAACCAGAAEGASKEMHEDFRLHHRLDDKNEES